MSGEILRVHFDLSPEADTVLSDVADRLGISRAQVIRRALGLSHFVLRHRAQGSRLVIEKRTWYGRVIRREVIFG